MSNTPFYIQKLRSELTERISRNSRYSIRAFARNLGLQPAALAQILAGERFLSDKLAQRLFEKLELSPAEERAFLKSLGESKLSRGLKRISPSLRRAAKTDAPSSAEPVRDLSSEVFCSIAEWYHYAILELTFTRGFVSSPAWIARRLGITQAEAKLAIDRLLSLELLSNKDGTLVKTDLQLNSADKHLTSAAHRRRQKQILLKSISALEQDPIEARNHAAMTLATSPELIAEAKRRTRAFLAEMTQLLESAPSKTEVYELSVGLFALSKPVSSSTPSSP